MVDQQRGQPDLEQNNVSRRRAVGVRATSHPSANWMTPNASKIPCLWISFTGGSKASPARKISHSISIQLMVGRLLRSSFSSSADLYKKLRREWLRRSRRCRFRLCRFARASHANPITPQGASVKRHFFGFSCLCSGPRLLLSARVRPAEAKPAAVRATG